MTGLLHRRTWFTSDSHLGHVNINRYCGRPFDSVDEMNEALIDRWNSKVDQDDVVWVLGDFALGDITRSLPLAGRLNGRKHLVAGNHDRCFHGFNKGRYLTRPAELEEWTRRYLDAGFASVVTGQATHEHGNPVVLPLRETYNGPSVMSVALSHFPLSGESRSDYVDRYPTYRPRPRARGWSVLLHGHVHNGWTVHYQGSGKSRVTMINVGVDVWDFAPVSSETILSIVHEGMPPCACHGVEHHCGAPGCLINGGPLDESNSPG